MDDENGQALVSNIRMHPCPMPASRPRRLTELIIPKRADRYANV
jgi:hypothetical protein